MFLNEKFVGISNTAMTEILFFNSSTLSEYSGYEYQQAGTECGNLSKCRDVIAAF